MSATPDVARVGVVGCGLMGSGIAEVSARAGLDVVVLEADQPAVAAGRARIEASLGQAVRRGKLAEEDSEAALGRIRVTSEADALGDRQLVVEAVPEVEPLKVETFRRIDEVVSDGEAVLASNTSSIPSRGSPRPTTSTPAWCRAAPTRWVRSPCPTSSASTP